MKNFTKTTVLFKAIDLDLKTILKKDIKAFKIRQQTSHKAALPQTAAA
jgi:hypothetical protein